VLLAPAGLPAPPAPGAAASPSSSVDADLDGLPVSGARLVRGVTRPSARAELAVPFDGIVAEVLVAEGDRVEAGTSIARMDDRVARASVAAARIAAERTGPVAFAEAEVRLAEARLERLREAGAATEFELEEAGIRVQQAEANLTTAREDVAQARRNLELEEARLELHRVRAPFAGHVVRIFRRPGEASERRQPLAILVDPGTLDAEVNLSIETWTRLETGRWYELLAGAPVGGTVVARLRTAEPYVDAATRTVRCVFEIPNPGTRLPSGFTVAVPWEGPAQAAPPEGVATASGAGATDPSAR
jgi:RND family efflux transporter MFP subunit